MRKLYIIPIITVILLFSCRNPFKETGNSDEQELLFNYLDSNIEAVEERFIVIDQIINLYRTDERKPELNTFLSSYIMENPKDPYNTYYLMIIARNYQEENKIPMAKLYYERIINREPDLYVRGNSIQFLCLSRLIQLEQDPFKKADYLQKSIVLFSDDIDLGQTYFTLARTYEEQGAWDQSYQAYSMFLRYPETEIPGEPDNIRFLVQSSIDFYNSDKSWTIQNIDTLIASIRWAVQTQNLSLLNRYKSKNNFFAMSWEQDETDNDSHVVFNFAPFVSSRVQIYSTKDEISNDQEVYIRSYGWTYSIPIWYLYFRRVNYPADPEINGRWEWAGVYLGEKL